MKLAWDDELERLTLEVAERLGDSALDDAMRQALMDVVRDGREVAPPAVLDGVVPDGVRTFAGTDFFAAYEVRLRELLTTH